MNRYQIEAEIDAGCKAAALCDLPTHIIAARVHKLGSMARALHKRYEAMCSYQWADTEAYRMRTERIEQQAARICVELNFTCEFQQDPRGWPLILSNGTNADAPDYFAIRLG